MDGNDYAEGMIKTPIVIDNVRLNTPRAKEFNLLNIGLRDN
jgi:hypothetical protein